MRLWLMRHGSTVGNEEHRYVGLRTDDPLSENGCAQCCRAGARLDVERVYVSSMLRARQTAKLCYPLAEQVVVDGLQEYDFGVFEGRTASEMEHDASYRAWVDGGCVGRCPGGESRKDFVRRSNAALEAILAQAARKTCAEVIVVAHGGTIMAALSAFAKADDPDPWGRDDYFRWQVSPCEGYVASVVVDGMSLSFGEVERFSQVTRRLDDGAG